MSLFSFSALETLTCLNSTIFGSCRLRIFFLSTSFLTYEIQISSRYAFRIFISRRSSRILTFRRAFSVFAVFSARAWRSCAKHLLLAFFRVWIYNRFYEVGRATTAFFVVDHSTVWRAQLIQPWVLARGLGELHVLIFKLWKEWLDLSLLWLNVTSLLFLSVVVHKWVSMLPFRQHLGKL